jgi:hypothetical protein
MVNSYVKDKLQSFHKQWSKFQSGHDHHLLYLYNIKMTKFEPQQWPWSSRRNPSLVCNTPNIYGKFIYERQITILSWIPKFQSRHDHHLLYLYNIKMTKFEPPEWLTAGRTDRLTDTQTDGRFDIIMPTFGGIKRPIHFTFQKHCVHLSD